MDMFQHAEGTTGKRERNRIRNRNAILKAARDCFRERGYENSTIRDIVGRTGLAAGTFYNYFSSKQDIFAALLTDFLVRLNDNLLHSRRHAGTREEFIHQAYLALYRATAQDPVVYEMAHQNDRALRELFGSDLLGLTMLSLEDDVRKAMKRGILPGTDHEYLCAAFFGVAYEVSITVARRAHQSPKTAEHEALRATRFSASLFLGGLPELTALP